MDLDPQRATTLGRSRDNTVVLHDEHVSRQHAKIFFQDGQWVIRDFGALNGTRLDGEPIQQQAVLQPGQEICIADMRLRFTVEEPLFVRSSALPCLPTPHTPPTGYDSRARLQADELAVIHDFMTGAVDDLEPLALIRRLLATVQLQTQADLVGFLSFDPEQPQPKLVLPDTARVDMELSRHLNQWAQQRRRTVWLSSEEAEVDNCESLAPFRDALCVLLKGEGRPLGALHVYKTGQRFSQREVAFSEVAADFAASSLTKLRLCRSLAAENTWLREQARGPEELIGDGPAMRRLRDLLVRAASCQSTVLIHGETGAGKEPVAHALHNLSVRARESFIVCNCGAITPTLLESELFGHIKGSFTSAVANRAGLFEQADDGTLFLDEIGDMSLDCQVKVLRVIEGKGFRPVGGTREIMPDARVIAATNKDLEQEVREGLFRQDLYYRLRVIYIHVPPLRDHPEDIPALADHFLERLAGGNRQRMKHLSKAAMKRLRGFAWPGNVRQLRAVLENAVIMCDGDTIEDTNLWLADTAAGADESGSLNLNELTVWAIRKALARTGGHMIRTAKMLGIARETLRLMMRKFQIDREGG